MTSSTTKTAQERCIRVSETVVRPLMLKKNLVRETEVWSLLHRVKNLNAGIRRPTKPSLIDGRTDAGVRIGAFQIAAITMVWTGRDRIQVCFFLMSTPDIRRHQEKKTDFAPFHSAPSYLRRSGRQQFSDVRRLSIRGSFDGRQMPAFRFLTQSTSDLVKNLNAGVRHPSELPFIDGRWTPALKLVPFGSPQI